MSRGIRPRDLRLQIIRPTLIMLGVWTRGKENLLMGTCAQESDMGYLLVQTNGNAKGIFQMEPRTHDDIWKTYLPRAANSKLKRNVAQLTWLAHSDELIYNLRYACAMSYVYYRWRLQLKRRQWPAGNDLKALARTWKVHYNTYKGAGTEREFIDSYKRWVR